MAPETEPLDVLTIGEMVVDFISVEKPDTLSNASTFERHDGKDWPEAVRFAHEVASFKLRIEGHVEPMIDRESLYAGLKSAGQRAI